MLTVGSLLFPLALLGLAVARQLLRGAGPARAGRLGFVTQNVQANTLVQTIAPDELRGRVMSVYSLMFFGTAPFGVAARRGRRPGDRIEPGDRPRSRAYR